MPKNVCFEIDETLLEEFKQWCKSNRFKFKEGFALAIKTLMTTPQPPPPSPALQKSVDRLEIEAEIKQIKTELRGLRYYVEHVLAGGKPDSQPVDSKPVPQQPKPNGNFKLPSFLVDNPWVQILENRSQEEGS
jgi:hypothetical protein